MNSQFVFNPPPETDSPYTISEINEGIACIIESGNTLIWAEGEISNWKKASSGHCYLRLKDELSQIPAVLWRNCASQLTFKPEDGIAVTVIASIRVYQRGGYYQLDVHKMIPAGLGDLHLSFQKLKDKLEKEGLFDQEHKKSLPQSVSSLGVITSKNGAAIKDIVRIVSARSPQTDIVLIDVPVQGEKAPVEIADALRLMNRYGQVDCIITGRGGGSVEDLQAFNDERVARAIFESEIPVISAVGHEIDYTIADFVSDLRAATPSAAAEAAVCDSKENRRYFEVCSKRFINDFVRYYSSMNQRCKSVFCSPALLKPSRLVLESAQSCDEAKDRYYKAMRHNLRTLNNKVLYAGARLQSLSPLSVLQRGYSVVCDKSNKSVRSWKQLKEGDSVSIRLFEGSAHARISHTYPPL